MYSVSVIAWIPSVEFAPFQGMSPVNLRLSFLFN